MSYARMHSEHSDIYLYKTVGGQNHKVYWVLSVKGDKGKVSSFDNLEELYKVLINLKKEQGVKIPDSALERIEKEIKEQDQLRFSETHLPDDWPMFAIDTDMDSFVEVTGMIRMGVQCTEDLARFHDAVKIKVRYLGNNIFRNRPKDEFIFLKLRDLDGIITGFAQVMSEKEIYIFTNDDGMALHEDDDASSLSLKQYNGPFHLDEIAVYYLTLIGDAMHEMWNGIDGELLLKELDEEQRNFIEQYFKPDEEGKYQTPHGRKTLRGLIEYLKDMWND